MGQLNRLIAIQSQQLLNDFVPNDLADQSKIYKTKIPFVYLRIKDILELHVPTVKEGSAVIFAVMANLSYRLNMK